MKFVSRVVVESMLDVEGGALRICNELDLELLKDCPNPYEFILGEIAVAKESLEMQANDCGYVITGGKCRS